MYVEYLHKLSAWSFPRGISRLLITQSLWGYIEFSVVFAGACTCHLFLLQRKVPKYHSLHWINCVLKIWDVWFVCYLEHSITSFSIVTWKLVINMIFSKICYWQHSQQETILCHRMLTADWPQEKMTNDTWKLTCACVLAGFLW